MFDLTGERRYGIKSEKSTITAAMAVYIVSSRGVVQLGGLEPVL